MYVPSRVQWGGVELTQTTDYPELETVELRVATASAATFEIKLRIPGWLQSAPEIRVNGRVFHTAAEPGTFATIRRKWKNHDAVQLSLPMKFRAQPVDEQHPKLAAMMRGPLMYVDVTARTGTRTLRPFYQVKDETYDTYLQS
jgi:DUF1680 family protein